MNPPKSIYVLGHKFKMSYPKRISANTMGETVTHERTIKVDSTLKPEMFRSTYLHELIHAILGISGMADAINDAQLEEGIVIALEHGLMQHVTVTALED